MKVVRLGAGHRIAENEDEANTRKQVSYVVKCPAGELSGLPIECLRGIPPAMYRPSRGEFAANLVPESGSHLWRGLSDGAPILMRDALPVLQPQVLFPHPVGLLCPCQAADARPSAHRVGQRR
eukprot:scaffold50_cov420-Prasinococcus_capsulatus_cf.AAC.15